MQIKDTNVTLQFSFQVFLSISLASVREQVCQETWIAASKLDDGKHTAFFLSTLSLSNSFPNAAGV